MLKRVSLFVAALFLIPAFGLAVPEVTPLPPLGIHSIEKMVPNGQYLIYTFKDGVWQEAGNLTFDRFFREREIDLSPFLLNNERAKVRLIHKGGGAAHIDSVFLGGVAPVEVSGILDGLALEKLSEQDFDVIDAFQVSLELIFPADGPDKVLTLTARVEGTTISKTPFQFPSENLFRQMGENSRFFTYRLNETSPLGGEGEGG